MKRALFVGVLVLLTSAAFAQMSNGQAVKNSALLVSRWKDWRTHLFNIWDSRFRDNQFIGPGTYEDYVYQQGALHGIARGLSGLIDYCISLDLRRLLPDEYGWLTKENSDLFYRNSLKRDSWYDNLSTERKEIFDRGYLWGSLQITGESARFPDIWDWRDWGN